MAHRQSPSPPLPDTHTPLVLIMQIWSSPSSNLQLSFLWEPFGAGLRGKQAAVSSRAEGSRPLVALWDPYFVFTQRVQTVQNVSPTEKKKQEIKTTETVGAVLHPIFISQQKLWAVMWQRAGSQNKTIQSIKTSQHNNWMKCDWSNILINIKWSQNWIDFEYLISFCHAALWYQSWSNGPSRLARQYLSNISQVSFFFFSTVKEARKK